jgi:predicted AlkP superfamily pyrophosphatase or phosphodiesterase
MTGLPPSRHGAVGNGWYFRDLAEVLFWRQSSHLVAGERIWETGRRRDAAFTCAKMFWWYNMYSSANFSVTPRPMYPADGRKIPDVYTQPADLRDELNARLGPFPLFKFWGPAADIISSRWITDATLHVMSSRRPTLTLCYLPHLDYNLQRLGPDTTSHRLQQDLRDIDAHCGRLIDAAERSGTAVIIVSEYGIMRVQDAVHINRVLRKAGLLRVREELGRELLDAGASDAFAVADHQVAHVYVKRAGAIEQVKSMLEGTPGVAEVLDQEGKQACGLDHQRSGDLVAIAEADRWFSYYHWLDAERAPDYARTVDIHRKPGYDPMELFLDPAIRFPALAVGWRLAKRSAGLRSLLDVIPIEDTSLVKGSHGRLPESEAGGPLLISSRPELMPLGAIDALAFKGLVLDHVFGGAQVPGSQRCR